MAYNFKSDDSFEKIAAGAAGTNVTIGWLRAMGQPIELSGVPPASKSEENKNQACPGS